jgi:hypothetical protein
MLNATLTLPTPIANPYIARVYYDIDNNKFDFEPGAEAVIPSPPPLPDGNFIDVFALPINVDTTIGDVINTSDLQAANIQLNVTNFDKNLTPLETDIQKFADKFNDASLGHDIQNNGGAVLNQRGKLNFSSEFIVTDNSGNDSTDIDLLKFKNVIYFPNINQPCTIPVEFSQKVTSLFGGLSIDTTNVQYSLDGTVWNTLTTPLTFTYPTTKEYYVRVTSFEIGYFAGTLILTNEKV